jgi:hypothetical protein
MIIHETTHFKLRTSSGILDNRRELCGTLPFVVLDQCHIEHHLPSCIPSSHISCPMNDPGSFEQNVANATDLEVIPARSGLILYVGLS